MRFAAIELMELIIRQHFHNLVLLLMKCLFTLKHRALNHITTILFRIPHSTISVTPPPCSSDLSGVISSKYLSLQITIFFLISDLDNYLSDSRGNSALMLR